MCVCVYIRHENVFYTYYCEDIHVCLARKRFSTCICEKCFDKTTMYLSKKLYFSQDTSLKFPEYEAYISATVIVSINNGAILFFLPRKGSISTKRSRANIHLTLSSSLNRSKVRLDSYTKTSHSCKKLVFLTILSKTIR